METVTNRKSEDNSALKKKKLPRKQTKCEHDYQLTLLNDYQCCLCDHIAKEV